jgi:hypothetical protein
VTMYADLDRLERTRPRCSVCGKVQYVTMERAMFKAVFLVASGAARRRLLPFFEHGTWHLKSKNGHTKKTPAWREKRRRARRARYAREKAREEQ